MQTKRHEGVTTYDITGLTVSEHLTLLRALHRSYRDHGDAEAESLRAAILSGGHP